jgi:ComF family protein
LLFPNNENRFYKVNEISKNREKMRTSLRTNSYTAIIDPLLNILFPSLCVFCDAPLPAGRKVICESCSRQLPKSSPAAEELLLQEISLKEIKRIYIGYYYSERLKRLIHLLKYEHFTSLASLLAVSIAAEIGANHKIDLILPVPLHPKKERERGYNQSGMIVKQLSRLTGIPFRTDLLHRKKYTVSQTALNKKERMRNVSGAFICSDSMENKNVLIVDDVITTGSTLKACAQCLIKKGAESIQLAAATTPPFG